MAINLILLLCQKLWALHMTAGLYNMAIDYFITILFKV